ncbi:MAG TPA: MarR family winged helix-turn-helix transcriptional regulator [Allosphingosinicella sp.]|nr:MarR family winged helix-turn-helix transcriptional regulator [Allosphingosinicella sp.]
MKKENKPEPGEETPDVADPSALKILYRPGPLVRRLHQIAVSVFLTHAKEFDLTPIQYGSLQLVETFPGIHQAGLGKLLALDRQTVSNVVQRLVDKGLLDRRERNARTSALYSTGAARALTRVMHERLQVVDEIILGPLDGEERETFMRLLLKLVESNNELSRAPSGGHQKGEGGGRARKAKTAA